MTTSPAAYPGRASQVYQVQRRPARAAPIRVVGLAAVRATRAQELASATPAQELASATPAQELASATPAAAHSRVRAALRAVRASPRTGPVTPPLAARIPASAAPGPSPSLHPAPRLARTRPGSALAGSIPAT